MTDHYFKKRGVFIITVSVILSAYVVCAEETEKPAEKAAEPVSEPAFELKALYTGEEWYNASGGLKQATTNIDNIDLSLAFDAEKKFGWTGATFMLDGLYNNGRSADSLTGATQQVSPIDSIGPQIFRLYQAWYNQDFFNGKTSVMTGLFDLNTDFDELDSAALFFNSGYSWNSVLDQSGRNGPSTFPNTSLGTRVRQRLDNAQAWTVEAAVVDGVPDNPDHPRENTININHNNGALIIGEGYYHPDDHTKILLGLWRYTGTFADQTVVDINGNPRQDSDNEGAYAGIHKRLYTIQGRRGIDGFANVGIGNGDINQFDRTLDVGVNFTGPIPSRGSDQLGFAWNIAHNSNSYQEAEAAAGTPAQSNEMDYELTYRATIIDDVLVIQPDVQYIVNPSASPGVKDSWIFGFHIEIGHEMMF